MAETKTKPKTNFHRGTGRRKSSVSRVRVMEGNGQVSINGRSVEDYFSEEKDRAWVLGPLEVTGLSGRLDVIADVKGGGATGQAGAVSLGIARAIKVMFAGTEEGEGQTEADGKDEQPVATPLIPEAQPEGEAEEPEADKESEDADPVAKVEKATPSKEEGGIIRKMRDAGYLTRDSRMKERKKYGRKGARRSFQFSKR